MTCWIVLRPLQWGAWLLLRALFALRYRVRVVGKPEVFKKPGPYLVLPNHPALADPPNILAHLWRSFRFRPLLLETNFQNRVLAPFAWLLRAIKVPDLSKISDEKIERAKAAVEAVIAALQAGDNVLLWPSGRLSRDGSEQLGGAQTTAKVLEAVPGVTVVLARTRGLYGSMYSFADRQPRVGAGLLKGIGLVLANLMFFAPRRRVTVTLEAFTADERPPLPTRAAVNTWLEQWYNADTPREQPTFVPHHFLFGPRTHTFPPPPPSLPPPKEFDLSKVKSETRAAVNQLVEEKLKRPLAVGEDVPNTTFAKLGLDSLEAMEVTHAVEKQFGFSCDEVPRTLGELWALAAGLQENAPPKPPPAGWLDPVDEEPLSVPGETVSEAFLNQAFSRLKALVVADDLLGGMTYEELVVGASAMAARFRRIAAPNVGLMLPASVGCDLAFLGLHLAGKVPVLLNWTTGPTNLEHAVKLAGLTHVVTSKGFVDRVGQKEVVLSGVEYQFLEVVRGDIGTLEKLRRLLAVRWFGGMARRRLLGRLPNDPHMPAVILFTSGSEKAPKAVPLTHANIISDQRACVEALQLRRNNSAVGFLPMFHSFGLTVTGLLPLFVGLRVVHHPDPTAAGAVVRKIAGYRATLIATTPTFLGFILDRAKPGDLASLRVIIVGAEKCPPHVFEKARQLAPDAEVLEGYGVTECSPVVSVNRPGGVKPGTIGDPLPGVDVRVARLDPEADPPKPTGEFLPPGERGMLLVSGPTVFPGYLGAENPPFTEVAGTRWYVTGDLAELDPTGAIVFHGRLKRFLKAGGEMISLEALEAPFTTRYPPTDEGPRVAIEGVETHGGRRIVLFTTEDVALRDANAVLQERGFRGVMRLDDVRKLDKIPVLGSGKTDYKVLRAMIVDVTAT